MSRRLWFFLSVFAGVALGLVYGWVINPVHYVDTTPDTLRVDYRTDYILMVAEVYHSEGDLTLAARRLALLGNTPPLDMVQQAVVLAGQADYASKDVDLMVRLAQGLETWSPKAQGTP